MMRNLLSTLPLLLVLTIAIPSALAQTSDAQLRRENERLREETHRLRQEVDELRQRLEALESRMAQLTQAIEALGAGEQVVAPRPIERPGPLPDEPLASPDAMLAHLQEAYRKELDDEPHDTSAEIARYKRLVERWVNKTNRELRGNVRWTVRILERGGDNANVDTTLLVIDPKTGAGIGEPFNAQIPARLLRQHTPTETEKPWLLEGVLSANLLYDPTRDVQGMFNDPPFIGPYAAFRYTLTVRNLTPQKQDARTSDGQDD